MTKQEAINFVDIARMNYICDPKECGLEKGKDPCTAFHCDEMHDALVMAIEALKLKDELMQEIPNFKEVISANYEMFMKYDVNDHTEIEQIAFDNFDKTVQDLQWLVDRLECDTE